MAARVLPLDLSRIFPNVVEDINDLQSFIDTAHLIVEEELTGMGLTEARLKQVELYLAAHYALVTHERGGLIKQKVGESEDMYQTPGYTFTGLLATRFGQQAIIMDSSGTLGALAKSTVKAQFRVVGDA